MFSRERSHIVCGFMRGDIVTQVKNESDLIVLSFVHCIEEINDMYMTKKNSLNVIRKFSKVLL